MRCCVHLILRTESCAICVRQRVRLVRADKFKVLWKWWLMVASGEGRRNGGGPGPFALQN